MNSGVQSNVLRIVVLAASGAITLLGGAGMAEMHGSMMGGSMTGGMGC